MHAKNRCRCWKKRQFCPRSCPTLHPKGSQYVITHQAHHPHFCKCQDQLEAGIDRLNACFSARKNHTHVLRKAYSVKLSVGLCRSATTFAIGINGASCEGTTELDGQSIQGDSLLISCPLFSRLWVAHASSSSSCTPGHTAQGAIIHKTGLDQNVNAAINTISSNAV